MSSSILRTSAALVRVFGWGLPVLLGWLFALPTWAQTVTRVGEGSVTLSVGASEGVQRGMTGKLATTDTVDGQQVPVFVAEFEVTEVRERSSTARITRGFSAEIGVGFRAIFNQRLEPPAKPRPTPQPAPRELSAEELLARGNRLFDVKDWAGAATAFRELVRRFPVHPEVPYAQKLLAAAQERDLAAKTEAAAAASRAQAQARATELAARAERLLVAEQWAEAKALADQALALDGANERARAARARAESHLGPPRELADPKSGVRFLLIPAGSFTMGCTAGDSECDDDEKPAHPVTISRPFYLAETETTVGQYRRFTGATGRAAPSSPSFSQTDEHPVVNVSWEDAKAFCDWTGGRLPTEAEWEYAARGGQSGWRYPWGNTISHDNANYGKETCCGGLAEGRDRWVETAPVRSFAANGYGLHDMAGNVWEWVADGYEASYYASSPATDPAGPATASERVLRGGSWYSIPWRLRVSFRGRNSPGFRDDNVGFRCARTGIP